MTYRGCVKNGVVVLDNPGVLAEGAEVQVEISPNRPNHGGLSLAQRLASVIGKAEGMPADWAENHDAYLREEHRG